MPRHPLANRPPSTDLGRYARRSDAITEPTFTRRSSFKYPDKKTGEHRWVAVSWHHITVPEALTIQRGGRFNPGVETRVAVTVGCLDCQGQYEAVVGQRCGAKPIEEQVQPVPGSSPDPDDSAEKPCVPPPCPDPVTEVLA